MKKFKKLLTFLILVFTMLGNSQDVQSVNSDNWWYNIMGGTHTTRRFWLPVTDTIPIILDSPSVYPPAVDFIHSKRGQLLFDSIRNRPIYHDDVSYKDFVTTTSITNALGYTPYNGTLNPNAYITNSALSPYLTSATAASTYRTQAQVRNDISLTTTGTSGAATYNPATGQFNIPNYAPGIGTVTSVGITSSDFAISGSPVTTAGNIIANLNTTGISAGTYNTVTVDTKGRVTAGSTSSSSTVSRSLNTGFQISATQSSRVTYTVTANTTVNLLNLTGSAMAYLEISPNNATWTTINSCGQSRTLGVAITLSIAESNAYNFSCEVPAGYYVRIRTTTSGLGTNSIVYTSGQETIY